MLAFTNTTHSKPQVIDQLIAHHRADQIIKGRYWGDGKGCAVGCTIHSGNHIEYERRFGIPVMLAGLEDVIFEGLPAADAKLWPLGFMEAVQPGCDLSRVGWQFLHWLLTDETVNPGINHPLVRDAVRQCADVLVPLMKGLPVDRDAAWSAERAVRAESAERAAWSAESAVRAARAARAESAKSAESAAWSAERAAWSAERAAWAESAKSAESAAWSAERAAWSAERAAYRRMADKLIELIRAAPINKRAA